MTHPLRPTGADFRALLALAAPIVVVQVGLMMMGVVDTIMVGHVSAANLAGVALGNLYFFGVCVFGMGTLMALDPLVAQAVGAGDQPAIARGIQRGLLLAAAMSVLSSLLLAPAEPILRMLRQPADVVPIAARYVVLSTIGVIPFFGFVVLRQSLQAMGRTAPIVVTIVVANVVNALLCWAFVFGHVGHVRGAEGAALATAIARWCMALGLLALGWRELRDHLVPLRRDVMQGGPLARMVLLGIPIGAQYQLEFGVFAVIALLMGSLGMIPIAAHQVAINIASLMFMVPLGVSSAASVRVGQAVGAGDEAGARRSAIASLATGLGFMMASGLVLSLAPALLARIYTTDAAVVALATMLIPIAGVFQVFDGLQVVAIGVLRGVGDTRTPMVVNVVGFWLVGFPISLWLGFRAGAGAPGLWWGLVVGLVVVAIVLLVRVQRRLARELKRLAIEDEPVLA